MKNKFSWICAAIVVLVVLGIGYNVNPSVRAIINRNQAAVQKADDATRYETLKKVEDTCRAMIASYEADRLTWEQYKDSDNEEKQGWADQAMMRANRTAATYNEYILKNSYVWEGNVPDDIRAQLVALGEADNALD